MENLQRQDSKESLNDSWVELYFQQLKEASLESGAASGATSGKTSGTTTPAAATLSQPVSLQTAVGQMEKLLLEAARESSRSSSSAASRNTSAVTSSRASPRSPHSPNNESADGVGPIREGRVMEQIKASDWIWDWSSRPEAHPPSDFLTASKFQHPVRSSGGTASSLSVRKSKVMKNGPFSVENLPKLLLTHAAAFLLGAALMFAYLKKYCKWPSSPKVIAPTHTFYY